MAITTTSHRSSEMIVSMGPQGPLVTDTKTEPVIELNIGDTSYIPVSPLSRRNETRLIHAHLSTTRIRNGYQSTTVATTSH
jgi:hypothetical protein